MKPDQVMSQGQKLPWMQVILTIRLSQEAQIVAVALSRILSFLSESWFNLTIVILPVQLSSHVKSTWVWSTQSSSSNKRCTIKTICSSNFIQGTTTLTQLKLTTRALTSTQISHPHTQALSNRLFNILTSPSSLESDLKKDKRAIILRK